MDGLSGQRSLWQSQQSMCRFVCHQHVSIRVRCYDCGGAGLDQNPQLFFRFAARIDLLPDLMKMFQRSPTAAIHLANEQACSEKSCKIQHIARKTRPKIPREIIEDFCEEGADDC